MTNPVKGAPSELARRIAEHICQRMQGNAHFVEWTAFVIDRELANSVRIPAETLGQVEEALREAWDMLERYEEEGQPEAPCDLEIAQARKRAETTMRALRAAREESKP